MKLLLGILVASSLSFGPISFSCYASEVRYDLPEGHVLKYRFSGYRIKEAEQELLCRVDFIIDVLARRPDDGFDVSYRYANQVLNEGWEKIKFPRVNQAVEATYFFATITSLGEFSDIKVKSPALDWRVISRSMGIPAPRWVTLPNKIPNVYSRWVGGDGMFYEGKLPEWQAEGAEFSRAEVIRYKWRENENERKLVRGKILFRSEVPAPWEATFKGWLFNIVEHSEITEKKQKATHYYKTVFSQIENSPLSKDRVAALLKSRKDAISALEYRKKASLHFLETVKPDRRGNGWGWALGELSSLWRSRELDKDDCAAYVSILQRRLEDEREDKMIRQMCFMELLDVAERDRTILEFLLPHIIRKLEDPKWESWLQGFFQRIMGFVKVTGTRTIFLEDTHIGKEMLEKWWKENRDNIIKHSEDPEVKD